MPDLVKFLLRHAAIGFGLAILVVFLIVKEDVGGIGTLAAESDGGTLAILLLGFMMGVTFASAQMGFAVMLSADDEEDGEDRTGTGSRIEPPLSLRELRIALRPPRPRR